MSRFSCACFFFLMFALAAAQDHLPKHEMPEYTVRTKSGNVYTGLLYYKTNSEVILLTDTAGFLVIYADSIQHGQPRKRKHDPRRITIRTTAGDEFSGILVGQSAEIVQLQVAGDTLDIPRNVIEQIEHNDVEILTKSHDVYKGMLVDQDDDFVRILITSGDTLRIPRDQITSIERFTDLDGKMQVLVTKQLIKANSLGLDKGEGYYQNIWLVFNQFGIGFSDHFQLNVGSILVPDEVYIWAAPRINFGNPESNLRFGVGGLLAYGISYDESVAGFYGQGMLGDHKANLSVGLGVAADTWEWYGVFTLDGSVMVGKRFQFMTENYLVIENMGFSTLSMRINFTHVAFDLGALLAYDSWGFSGGIPIVGLLVPIDFAR